MLKSYKYIWIDIFEGYLMIYRNGYIWYVEITDIYTTDIYTNQLICISKYH